MVVSAFPKQVALCAGRCKAISAFGLNNFYCRKTLLTFPCDGEYYDNT